MRIRRWIRRRKKRKIKRRGSKWRVKRRKMMEKGEEAEGE